MGRIIQQAIYQNNMENNKCNIRYPHDFDDEPCGKCHPEKSLEELVSNLKEDLKDLKNPLGMLGKKNENN